MRIIVAITLIAATSAFALDPPTMVAPSWNITYAIGPEGRAISAKV